MARTGEGAVTKEGRGEAEPEEGEVEEQQEVNYSLHLADVTLREN